jgi:hypothetical protein
MSGHGGPPDDRQAELAAGLATVARRIDAAMAASGRQDRPTLIVVTKFFPASDVDLLAELGVRDVGENRDQEASTKFDEVAHRRELTLHFIGQLQRNKARSVVRYADVVQSVDRPRLVTALDRAAQAEQRRLDVLVQVGLEDAADRGGVPVAEAEALADAVGESEALDLRGVMAVAPLDADPRAAFARLRTVAEAIRAAHPQAGWISAGMSGDLEEAIAEGATHLRVGTAILGSRPSHG